MSETPIDFEAAERWAKAAHPGIDGGDWELARAYLALAAQLREKTEEIEKAQADYLLDRHLERMTHASSISAKDAELATASAEVKTLREENAGLNLAIVEIGREVFLDEDRIARHLEQARAYIASCKSSSL